MPSFTVWFGFVQGSSGSKTLPSPLLVSCRSGILQQFRASVPTIQRRVSDKEKQKGCWSPVLNTPATFSCVIRYVFTLPFFPFPSWAAKINLTAFMCKRPRVALRRRMCVYVPVRPRPRPRPGRFCPGCVSSARALRHSAFPCHAFSLFLVFFVFLLLFFISVKNICFEGSPRPRQVPRPVYSQYSVFYEGTPGDANTARG